MHPFQLWYFWAQIIKIFSARMDNQLLLLKKIYQDLASLADADYQQHITTLTEEQPYLLGLLFNLDEDFEEHALDFLVHATLVVSQSFKALTYPMGIVGAPEIEKLMQAQVESFDAYFATEAVSYEGLFAQCSSPDTVAALFYLFEEDNGEEVLVEDPPRIILMLSLIVSVLEHAVVVDGSTPADVN